MRRLIVLDTFPLSSAAKPMSPAGAQPTVLDECRAWISDCIAAGNQVVVPAICYYEVLRELERLRANVQISRLRAFCRAHPGRYLPLEDRHLETAARLWADTRNAGLPTASLDALDGDVILAAQVMTLISLGHDPIVATTNVAHISRFVPAKHWNSIAP